MSVLERGGNAFDAAVATGFVLQVVEPHLNGPGGEMPAVFYSAERDEVRVLCGQGSRPRTPRSNASTTSATSSFRAPEVLAACVPGAFGAWLLLLREFGTWRLEDVLEFAIGYAERGYPLVRRVRLTIDRTRGAARDVACLDGTCLPAPEVGALFRNPALAATYRRIVGRAAAARGRRRSSGRALPSTRASSRRRSIASQPPREGCSRVMTSRRGSRPSSLPQRSTTAGSRCARPVPGEPGPAALQQLALLEASTSPTCRGGARPRRHRVRKARVR